MAFALDPGGAAAGLWQAGQHIGATLVNEPGTVIWNELITADPAGPAGFYQQAAGLTTSDTEMEGQKYTMSETGGQPVGGTTAPQMLGTPNHWQVRFVTADADGAAAKAAELGGSVPAAPFGTPAGRMAVLRDPQGAVFSIIQPAGQAC